MADIEQFCDECGERASIITEFKRWCLGCREEAVIYEDSIADAFYELAEEIRDVNNENGWDFDPTDWKNPEKILSKLMLVVTEVSEATEEVRMNDLNSFVVEVADIFIRLLDMTSGLDITEEVVNAIFRKNEKNATRGYKHGKAI